MRRRNRARRARGAQAAGGVRAAGDRDLRGADRDAGRMPSAFAEGQRDWPGFRLRRRAATRSAKAGGSKSRTAFAIASSMAAANGPPNSRRASGWWFSLDLGIEVDGERVRAAAGADLAARPAARSRHAGRARRAGAQRHGVRQARRRPPCGAAARAHQGDPGHPRRAVRPGEPVRRRQARDIGRRDGRPRRGRGGDTAALARRRAAARTGRAAVALFGDRQGRAAGRAADRVASLSARRARLAAISARLRARRHPRRRYGARQDRAGARPYPGRKARGPARPALPRRLPDQRRAELARRGGAPRARTAGPVVARRRSRASASPKSATPIWC